MAREVPHSTPLASPSTVRDDAAPVVVRAVHACFELIGAFAGEDEVRVRVDEAGDDGRVLRVDQLVGGRRVARSLRPTGHTVIVDHHRGVVESTDGPVAERRIVRRQFTDVRDDASGHHPSRIGMRTPRSSAVCSAIS